MISVIIITKNEEKHIARCISSVGFADEVIVVDSGSTDNTVNIAKELGAKVIKKTNNDV
jgi:glycosyltransferase involved in cell wall biosynthesis